MRYRLRFWAENVPPAEIVDRAMPLLVEYSAGIACAVFSESLHDENARAFRAIKEAGVELTYWPLLSPENGYFPGEKNVPDFTQLVHRVVGWAGDNGIMPDMIAVDQELPFDQMVQLVEEGTGSKSKALAAAGILHRNRDRQSYLKAKAELVELDGWIKARGVKTLSAVLPWVALELEGDGEMIQDMMETPVSGVAWDIISPMMYVSMLTGMSGGLISTRDANWLVFDTCLRLRTGHPRSAGVSLGVTGTGVLGNEPTFSNPGELITGVEAALAAGVRDISIYNLEGVISREDPRAWLEALRKARPRVPPRSRKVDLVLAAARNIYRPLAGITRRPQP